MQTAERTSSSDASENVIFQRHLVAYQEASRLISGKVLEVGSGMGYGIQILAPKSAQYVAIDKYKTDISEQAKLNNNIEFFQLEIPPLTGFQDNSFDYVVTFQVIEHIQNDDFFVQEIHRVLKPHGKLILTTPNIKMSLTRNPWHVREYTIGELKTLQEKYFSQVSIKGIFGNQKVMDYYNKNKKAVNRITRFDIFNLQYRLPRQLLQIPYDILNRLNRKRLLNKSTQLVNDISVNDYSIDEATDNCFDLFSIAVKKT